ncbi:hypothetical protein [Herbaspirillum seropedicae]|uniref:hypothetical protein n=1 Tax=Herbaspirillum seropedicae TaxID=964 RepID=UPI003FCE25E6
MTTITTEKIEELRELAKDKFADFRMSIKPAEAFALLDLAQRALNANPVVLSVDDAERAMVPQPQEGQALPDSAIIDALFEAQAMHKQFEVAAIQRDGEWHPRVWLRDFAHAVNRAYASQLALPAGPVPEGASLGAPALDCVTRLNQLADCVIFAMVATNATGDDTSQWKAINDLLGAIRDLPAPSPAVAQPVADERDVTLPYEQALSELVGKIDPDLDSGNIVADAHAASRRLDSIIGLAVAGEREKSRLDFIEANPQLSLRFHKKRWALIGMTNYEYEVFKNLRDAIDAARAALCPPAEEGTKA